MSVLHEFFADVFDHDQLLDGLCLNRRQHGRLLYLHSNNVCVILCVYLVLQQVTSLFNLSFLRSAWVHALQLQVGRPVFMHWIKGLLTLTKSKGISLVQVSML